MLVQVLQMPLGFYAFGQLGKIGIYLDELR